MFHKDSICNNESNEFDNDCVLQWIDGINPLVINKKGKAFNQVSVQKSFLGKKYLYI